MPPLTVTRTRHVRQCPDCYGAGERIVNNAPQPFGLPDPQCDEAVECSKCGGLGEVETWVDPLLILAENRRFGRRTFYARSRQKALAGSPLARLRMIEAAINCDLACRSAVQAWRRNAA